MLKHGELLLIDDELYAVKCSTKRGEDCCGMCDRLYKSCESLRHPRTKKIMACSSLIGDHAYLVKINIKEGL